MSGAYEHRDVAHLAVTARRKGRNKAVFEQGSNTGRSLKSTGRNGENRERQMVTRKVNTTHSINTPHLLPSLRFWSPSSHHVPDGLRMDHKPKCKTMELLKT